MGIYGCWLSWLVSLAMVLKLWLVKMSMFQLDIPFKGSVSSPSILFQVPSWPIVVL